MWNAPFVLSSLPSSRGRFLKRRPLIAHMPSLPFALQPTKDLMRRLILPTTLLLLTVMLPASSWYHEPNVDDDRHPLSAVFGPKEQLGAWFQPPLPEEQNRMQAVHIALLPSGKVLMVNGSSNRDRIQDGQVMDGISPLDYAAVNNSSLFDPSAPATSSGLTRIASPPSPINFNGTSIPNDLFCSGHVQLPDGNVLFAGGTQNSCPGERFLGSRTTNLFNWKTETWTNSGMMTDGHWYPSLVPLGDGRIFIMSGLSWDHFTNSSVVEIYEPTAPDGSRWSSLDV